MTADRNPPRVLRYIMVFIGLVLVAFLISVIAHVRTVRHYNERAGYAKQQVEKLKSRCPKNVSAEKWDRGVDWTSNAISQIYFSPSHGDLESLESLCQFLDQETEKDVGLKTLRSIWDEYEKARGRSQRLALRFRDIRLLTEEPVTDDDLVDLWSLDRCLYLDLNNTAVTDAGMRHLADSRLESLELWNTKVGDAGIKDLMQMKNLTSLHLGHTLITDDGLKLLLSKPALRSLSLSNTGITDEGLTYVGQLTRLETLWLEGTKITDTGLEQLTNLQELTQLDLTATLVTSEGVLQLKVLRSLRMLILKNTGISKTDIAALQKEFGDCKIRN